MFSNPKSLERNVNFKDDVLLRYDFCGKFVSKKSTLDLGCGLGYGTNYLFKKFSPSAIDGLDFNSHAIDFAIKNFSNDRIKFRVGDFLGELNFLEGKKYEVITALEIIEHIDPRNVNKFLKNIQSCILDENSHFILSTPNKLITSPITDKPLNPFHLKEYFPSELNRLLSLFFSNVSMYGIHTNNIAHSERRKLFNNSRLFNLLFLPLKSKTIRKLIATFIPVFLRLKLNSLIIPPQKIDDLYIQRDNLDKCETILAVCTL